MICKPPIIPRHFYDYVDNTPTIHYVRDKEKLDKVVKCAEELGLQVYIGEAPDKLENDIMIKIPYKKVILFDRPIKAKEYKE